MLELDIDQYLGKVETFRKDVITQGKDVKEVRGEGRERRAV